MAALGIGAPTHPSTTRVMFSRPAIGEAEMREVRATLESGWLTTGPRVKQFEQQFAAYVGAPHAVAVNSCTAALHLSLLAAGIGPGDEVVTTPLTFCATANTIVHVGATPVFADIDPRTMNLDPAAAAAAISPRTRALLPVHFAGRPVNVRAFREMADHAGLTLIEDAAHCVEGIARGKRIGTTADYTCFSFYATKNLTTGEGGMLTTASAEAAGRIRIAALHGMSRDAWTRYSGGGAVDYDVVMPGFKYNMMDLQAAIGLHQLARIEDNLRRREAIWECYDEGLADLPIERPAPVEFGSRHARHLYTILVDRDRCGLDRAALSAALTARGVATSLHFRALHLHTFYADRFGLKRGQFPHAELVSDQTLSLPLSPAMTEDEGHYVVEQVRGALRMGGR
ncbi:MAG: DegT/DnrJ/EryC1/StrS aminotransferase family protein [Acidobacteria bacterium]|nr:DegT/DnrJ/EryC1/StrS aminotransferase family protein [Acidobacteriota bacterium]